VNFIDVEGTPNSIFLEKNSLAFTYCQVPIIYTIASVNQLKIIYTNGQIEENETMILDDIQSKKIFQRTGEIFQINISFQDNFFRK
uniref:hypothetical protein n=1 Tax=Flavobacterium sp. TaxID=239 RepID=UPI00286E4FBF